MNQSNSEFETKDTELNLNTPSLMKIEPEGANTNLKPHYMQTERLRILKNVVIISASFMILFTAIGSMANLQSSLNPEEGLGTYSRACGYGAMVLSSLILPTFLIQRYTLKWTLVVSMAGSVISIVPQFYPRFSTMIPAALISGLFSAPLWSAKCTYITQIGEEYAKQFSQNPNVIITRFFGIFFFIFQTSKVWGNLLATQVLAVGYTNVTPPKNISICGVNFCPANAQDSAVIVKPMNLQIYTLAGVYLGLACGAVVLAAVFLDSLQRYGEKKQNTGTQLKSQLISLLATFKQMANPVQIILIPLTVWSGLEQGFYSADFYQGFVTCAWGIENLGYVGICYGVCDAIGSFSCGFIVRYIGRIPVFLFGACLNIGVIINLFYWQPDPGSTWKFFVIAAIWGVADSIWQTQINAFYGIIFSGNKEAAFSNYRLWESLGFILAFTIADLLCTKTKMYFLVGTLVIGMTGYLRIEFSTRQISNTSASPNLRIRE